MHMKWRFGNVGNVYVYADIKKNIAENISDVAHALLSIPVTLGWHWNMQRQKKNTNKKKRLFHKLPSIQ